MRERGFIPFSTAGFLILMLVVAMVGHASWSRHQHTLGAIEDSASTGALTIAASIQNDIQHVARYAIYRALWDVSKHADNYASDQAREREIERLVAEYFAGHLVTLPPMYERLNADIEFELDLSVAPSFDLQQANGGYVIARIELPEQTRITVSSPDNRLTITLPYTSFDVWADSRYFLLQERMNRFIRKLDDVRSTWRWAEYATAWGGAYLGGRVELSESRSKALFEMAWANHELSTFGSSDYLATSEWLSRLDTDALSGLFEANATVKPLTTADVQAITVFIDRGLEALRSAEGELGNVMGALESAVNDVSKENAPDSVLENIWVKLNSASASVDRAQGYIREAHQQFQQFLDFVARLAQENPLMRQLHEGLTNPSEACQALARRVSLGIEGTGDKLAELKIRLDLQASNLTLESLENSLKELHEYVCTSIQNLLAEPSPQSWIEYDEYPEPNDYDPEVKPQVTKRRIGIYIVSKDDGTIGALRTVLGKVKTELTKIEEIVELTPSEQENSHIDEELKKKLIDAINSQRTLAEGVEREEIYEISPPAPIRSRPGLSVFHNFRIKDVSYKREDPMGWFSKSEPTPIYLWFIGVTLYWAQWNISLELDGEAVERVFDYNNPTLPRPLFEGSDASLANVHKPLGYRYEVPQRRFGFTLTLISLRHFRIDAD